MLFCSEILKCFFDMCSRMCLSVDTELIKRAFLQFQACPPHPLSPQVPADSLILALFLHPTSYFPLQFPECVLCSANAGCLPAVCAVWLAGKHAELQWVCMKCISVGLFEVIQFCLCIPETRKSACGVVYTVKKLHKIEEEETVPACKKAKTQAWASCQQEPPRSLYSVAESSSTFQLAWFLTYWLFFFSLKNNYFSGF